MSKEDFVDAMESLTTMVEVDSSSPYIIIAASIIVLFANIFIIHKLSFLSHSHKLEDGIIAILYYVFEVLNFIIAFLFVDVLLKTYNQSKSKARFVIAFVLSVMNPILFSIVFY